ncbi:monofunctional biosynthetic peptidoglycan transglycosylase [Limimaricola pyoseonensis]|uniref:Biosynthetic peptidoglycan transglycosylase n=1 Tax=Limimaricola pyoseonensis TaxID=521013 RepID=A0A1G7EUT9_9RHOB|nr:monofunctional biosynthetic peptidoglycan transglycosylase [Limimaricola pyoseonensis]SDE67399.1 monofunctional biosynthetic peptidoglycan transglycosylase [Limimaricola pyoseonensis]
MTKPVDTRKKTARKGKPRVTRAARARPPLARRLLRWALGGIVALAAALLLAIAAFSVIAPPTTPYMVSERARLGRLDHQWVPMEEIAPVMARAAVAAEDANFCLHWGLDLEAIRRAMAAGGNRGASTISQQVVKNVFLWQGRSWPRKALEAAITPAVEAFWTKRRILETYLNVAEFDEGVFGVEAAALHYFGVRAAELDDREAARLAAILPDPKGRSASDPGDFTRRRAAAILDGAATIRRDGRDDCFEGEG